MLLSGTPSNLLMRRTAHAVGQGLFCTEKFLLGARETNIVYDCGSKNEGALEQCINNTFAKDYRIDLMFLSHFDQDHVKGLKKISDSQEIVNIVLPQYDDIKWYVNLEDGLKAEGRHKSTEGLVERFEAIVARHKINVIQVAPEDNGIYQQNNNPNERGSLPPENGEIDIDIAELSSTKRLSSGTPLGISGGLESLWSYRPIVHLDYRKVKALKADLDKAYNSPKPLSEMSGKEIRALLNDKKKFEDIKAVYARHFKKSNEISMLVISTGTDGHVYEVAAELRCPYACRQCKECTSCNPDTFSCHGPSDWREGCLFTGDADMGVKKYFTKLKRHPDELARIGLLQIPHHGAFSDLKVEYVTAVFPSLSRCFVSYGLRNSYRHPSLYNLHELRDKGLYVHEVYDDTTTQYTELINIHPKTIGLSNPITFTI